MLSSIQATVSAAMTHLIPHVAAAVMLLCVQNVSRAAPAVDLPSQTEIEERILKERSRIENAKMTIALEVFQHGSAGTMNTRSKLSVWCSGSKIRIDRLMEPWLTSSGSEIPGHTEVTCRGCYSADTIFEHSDLPSSDERPRAATITDAALWKRPEIPNPLLLGFTPKGYLRTGGMPRDAYLGGQGRDHVVVSQANYNDADCWKVTFEKQNPRFTSNVVYFVSDEEGGSIVHIEETAEAGGTKFVDAVDCRNRKIADGGPWFPKELVFERRKNGEVINRESLKIEVTAINDKAIDDAFSLSEIPIFRPGTHVSRQSADPDPAFHDGDGVWTGNRISATDALTDAPAGAPAGAAIDEPAKPVAPAGGNAHWRRALLAASSVGLLVLLGIALWKRR